MEDCNHLLIDGKNCLYRSVFAGRADPKFKGKDYFVIVARSIAKYVRKFKPQAAHIFWDSPSSEVWRKEFYPGYKANRGKKTEVEDDVRKQTIIAIEILKWMGFRQYYKENMEADDLIYAFCRSQHECPTVIISSDTDLLQIPYSFPEIHVHNPNNKKRFLEPKPHTCPVTIKSLTGDNTDDIVGYNGIGPIRAAQLARDIPGRQKFFEEKATVKVDGKIVESDDSLFYRNKLLIDLSLCPGLLENIMYIEKKLAAPVFHSKDKVDQVVRKYNLRSLMLELPKYHREFQGLMNGDRNTRSKNNVNAGSA